MGITRREKNTQVIRLLVMTTLVLRGRLVNRLRQKPVNLDIGLTVVWQQGPPGRTCYPLAWKSILAAKLSAVLSAVSTTPIGATRYILPDVGGFKGQSGNALFIRLFSG